MILRTNHHTTIEDLHPHGPELVGELRRLLAAGAQARPDARRKDFYEVLNHERVFYIHLRPNGRVWLLAVWPKAEMTLPAAVEPALTFVSSR